MRGGRVADRLAPWIALIVAVLLHAAALMAVNSWNESPVTSGRRLQPFYTRVVFASTMFSPVTALSAPAVSGHALARRDDAAQASASTDAMKIAPVRLAAASAETAVRGRVPEPETEVSLAASAPEPTAQSAPNVGDASSAAAAAPPAYLNDWPPNMRLTYLTYAGGYPARGGAQMGAQLLWQRLFTGGQARYRSMVRLSVGANAGAQPLRLTSQGSIAGEGLAPETHEGIGEDIGEDIAGELIELAHCFASGQAQPVSGGSVSLKQARPDGGVEEWVYDVLDEEVLYLPRLGAVRAIHLRHRRIEQSESADAFEAQIWLAASLRYLPVRIVLTQGAATLADLHVQTIEQE